MSVLRKRLDTSFTVIPNDLLEADDLDLAGKGIVAYMLAKPDGWSFSAERLARQLPEGREAIRSALGRAEAAGWVLRRDERQPDGTFHRIVLVRNNRLIPWDIGGSTDDGLTEVGDTELGATVAVSNTELAKTELASTEEKLAPSARPRDEVWDALVAIYGQPTASGKGAMNAAAKVLRDFHADPAEITWMVTVLRQTDLSWAVTTPNALAKHFGERHALVAELDKKPFDRAASIAQGGLTSG